MSANLSWAEIDQILPDGETTAEMVDAFLRTEEIEHLVLATVRSVCNRWSIHYPTYGDDLANECRTTIFLMLTDSSQRASAGRIRNGLGAAVYLRFGDRVKALVESPEWTGTRGASSRVRRARALASYASRLAESLGRTPTQEEIVAGFNHAMTGARRDAARQGMVATVDDLVSLTPQALDPALALPALSHDDDFPLVGPEARMVLERALARCEEIGSSVALVARAWLGHFDADPPYISTISEIVAETGLSATAVRRLRAQAEQVVRDVLAQEFGIGEDDLPS